MSISLTPVSQFLERLSCGGCPQGTPPSRTESDVEENDILYTHSPVVVCPSISLRKVFGLTVPFWTSSHSPFYSSGLFRTPILSVTKDTGPLTPKTITSPPSVYSTLVHPSPRKYRPKTPLEVTPSFLNPRYKRKPPRCPFTTMSLVLVRKPDLWLPSSFT